MLVKNKRHFFNIEHFHMLSKIIPTYHFFQHNQNEIGVVVPKSFLIACLKIFKQHINLKLDLLTCISGVDLITNNYRFCIVYELLSITFNFRLRVKIYTNETEVVSSVVCIYPSANWWEREVWDMFGIYFRNNKDLRRLLTDYGFEGYPLRKDFPICGYIELRYSTKHKRIINEFVNFSQEQKVSTQGAQW